MGAMRRCDLWGNIIHMDKFMRPSRLPSCLLLLTALFFHDLPLHAQPPSGEQGGPWAADADGDGCITRDEMRAYMERRFGLMDSDGDGLVPVQSMQRMLGHDRPRVAQNDSVPKDGHRGPAGGGGMPPGGGPGSGFGETGGPPPGGRPPADGQRPNGKIQSDGAPPPGRAMPYPEDGNDDGMIDAAEFLAPALAMFADQDVNGDGILTAEELPPPPGRLRIKAREGWMGISGR